MLTLQINLESCIKYKTAKTREQQSSSVNAPTQCLHAVPWDCVDYTVFRSEMGFSASNKISVLLNTIYYSFAKTLNSCL
jgi:hypothetical protein